MQVRVCLKEGRALVNDQGEIEHRFLRESPLGFPTVFLGGRGVDAVAPALWGFTEMGHGQQLKRLMVVGNYSFWEAG